MHVMCYNMSLTYTISYWHWYTHVVGEPFIELKEEMKFVYALYCKNYDDVTHLLEQVNRL